VFLHDIHGGPSGNGVLQESAPGRGRSCGR
jgi:hypothetical protein